MKEFTQASKLSCSFSWVDSIGTFMYIALHWPMEKVVVTHTFTFLSGETVQKEKKISRPSKLMPKLTTNNKQHNHSDNHNKQQHHK